MAGALPASSRRCLAGLVQMCSVNDVHANFSTCARLVKEAKERGAKIVFLPECFSFIGGDRRGSGPPQSR